MRTTKNLSRIALAFAVFIAVLWLPDMVGAGSTGPKGDLALGDLLGRGSWFAYLAAFAGGVLTSLTPCVYPLIPITVSIFGARKAGSRGQAALLSGLYVLGIAVTYSALGVGAALTGKAFGSVMQNGWVMGGVALVLCRADKAHLYTDRPVFLKAAVVRSRRFGSFEVLAPSIALEHNAGPTVDTSKAAFEMAGMGPEDIDLAQLQDTEAGAEIMHMAENGFCEHGEQEHMLANGDTEIGGRLPVNTDGGCLANGEPIGASGLRQVYENVLQLRGDAGERQVPGEPRTAYTHVYGAPGISGVTILAR